MKLNSKGFGIVEIAAWMIVVGFLGMAALIGSAITSPKTSLSGYKAIHEKPKEYDKMTPSQRREYWMEYFNARQRKGG